MPPLPRLLVLPPARLHPLKLELAQAAEAGGGNQEEGGWKGQDEMEEPASSGGHSWGSGGSTLGGEGKESQVVGGPPATAPAGGGAAKRKISKVAITRYSDGFTLDMGDGEGEVRRPGDPANAIFLQSLEKGEGARCTRMLLLAPPLPLPLLLSPAPV